MSFEAIYRRYHQGLYRYCLAIVGNPEDAQDALQNAMVKAMRALQGEKRQIKLKPWLYRIAHNESIDLLRKRRPTESLDAELAAAGPSAAEAVETRERLRGLIADLGELPDRQRGALTMRELAGLSFEQIGVAFDTSAAVARQTVYEARLGLREMSEGRDIPCAKVCSALSDGDGRIVRRRDIRAHLRACPSCRAFREDIAARRHEFAALAPLPAVAAAGLFRGILGGAGGASGAGVAGSVGAGAGSAVATSAIVKSAATVAVVAAVGAGAADRGGLIDVPLPGGRESSETRTTSDSEPGIDARQGLRSAAAVAAARRQSRGASDAPRAEATGGKASKRANANARANGRRGRHDLPASSGRGRQTAAAHRASRGGRSAQHAPAVPQPRAPPSPSKSSPHVDQSPPAAPPAQVEPDKSEAPTSQSSSPTDNGTPRGGAR